MSRKFHSFGVKEAAVALVTADDPSSNSGVTNGAWIQWPGVQSGGYDLSQQQEKLLGDGIILAYESAIDDIPIDLEFGQSTPDVDALILGCASWATPDGQKFAVTEDIGDSYVSVKLRTDKTGVNGADLVILFPKVKVSSLSRKGQQRQFRGNQFKAAASYTESKYEIIRDGVAAYKRCAVIEEFRVAKAVLVSTSDSTAPTVTSPSSTVTGSAGAFNQAITFSENMNLNTVNKYTLLLLDNSNVAVACSVAPTTGSTVFTITSTASLTAGSYTLKATTDCTDAFGNHLATAWTKAVTIS